MVKRIVPDLRALTVSMGIHAAIVLAAAFLLGIKSTSMTAGNEEAGSTVSLHLVSPSESASPQVVERMLETPTPKPVQQKPAKKKPVPVSPVPPRESAEPERAIQAGAKTEEPETQPVSDEPANGAAAEEPPASTAEPAGPPAKGASAAHDGDAHRRYLAGIISRIDKSKIYPEAARRRGLQGKVKVCFMLKSSGAICDLRIEGPVKALCRAAEDTVMAAAPFAPPPPSMACPKEVAFDMEFLLD